VDFYKVASSDFRELDGYTLFSNIYGDRMVNAMSDIYPQYQFQSWKFSRTSKDYWRESWTHRRFLDSLCISRGKRRFSDLFKFSLADFKKDASRLLGDQYNFSPSSFLQRNYSEFAWLPWNFDRVPKVLSPLSRSVFIYETNSIRYRISGRGRFQKESSLIILVAN
jgi:hypothetical protein